MSEKFYVFIVWYKNKTTQDIHRTYVTSKKRLTKKQILRVAQWKITHKNNNSNFDCSITEMREMTEQQISKYSPYPPEDEYDTIYLKYFYDREEILMRTDLYDFMAWGDYNAQIQKLAEKADPESWNFEGKSDNYILKNYLEYTFAKLQDEDAALDSDRKKIIETDSYCIFNTGLFTPYFSPIYIYAEPNKNFLSDPTTKKWFFKDFKDEYELGALDIDIAHFPERADYFFDTGRLVFNCHYKINVQYDHILENLNTAKRLPEEILNLHRSQDMLIGVINTAINRVVANYKLAVPSYYRGKIQLLIPLCFDDLKKPDVVLVLDQKKSGYYQASTCLSMEMAYVDARLIAKPESNWLIASNILGSNIQDEQSSETNDEVSE